MARTENLAAHRTSVLRAPGFGPCGAPGGRHTVKENEECAPAGAREVSRAIELALSRILRAGVLIASLLIASGLLLLLLRAYAGGVHPTAASVLAPGGAEAHVLRSPGEVLAGLARREPDALADLGLFVLMATPLASILLSALQFLLERNYKFVAVALLVLGVIAFSFFSGVAR